jgi:hypothetical protein
MYLNDLTKNIDIALRGCLAIQEGGGNEKDAIVYLELLSHLLALDPTLLRHDYPKLFLRYVSWFNIVFLAKI